MVREGEKDALERERKDSLKGGERGRLESRRGKTEGIRKGIEFTGYPSLPTSSILSVILLSGASGMSWGEGGEEEGV